MGKTIQEILSELENARQEKKEKLKEEEEEYYEKKELLKKSYVKLLWDKDLNRPLNPFRDIYKGSNQGGTKRKKSGFIGQFALIENITPIGDIDGVNRFFTLPQFPVPDSEHVILNGLLQDEGFDYVISGNTVEFLVAPSFGEIIQVSYLISL